MVLDAVKNNRAFAFDHPEQRIHFRETYSSVVEACYDATEEYERMLDKVAEVVGDAAVDSWKRFVEGLWLSGLRLGEALILSWDGDAPFTVDTGHPCQFIFSIKSHGEYEPAP